jgi:Mg-chelatase subunit ChlD
MHSVLQNDKQTIAEGKLIADSYNQAIGAFTPDMFFDKLTQNYSLAKKLYGETLIRELSGYDPNYVEKNIRIPEFQRELKTKINDKIEQLKKKKLLDKEGFITEQATFLASISMAMEELDSLTKRGLGEKISKRRFFYGEREDYKDYKKDRYKDLAIKRSVKKSIRRGHKKLREEDLKAFERKSRTRINIIYCIDNSGSMKGEKIKMAKKAGIALAYKAITEKDKVGIVVFGSEIEKSVEPMKNFPVLLKELVRIRPSGETNITLSLKRAIELLTERNVNNHVVLLSDALQTVGKEEEVLEQASIARNSKITISVVGIELNDKGEVLAKKIVDVGEGKLYAVKKLENLDNIILQDYYMTKR